MAFSSVGRTKVAAHFAILLVNLIVLALSARVNIFQEFFFVADRFPFGLSIVTFILLGLMVLADFVSSNSYTGRPQFEIAMFSAFTIFWLAFNAFSTSRWNSAPLNCGEIPSDYPDVIQWCHELSALRVFVWIEWVMILLTVFFTLRYAVTQSNLGHKHVFEMPLSRYSPELKSQNAYGNNQYGQEYDQYAQNHNQYAQNHTQYAHNSAQFNTWEQFEKTN
jgi:uncharacterized integral membrane protein